MKHPEHLQQHEMLQVLQRESLKENWGVVRKMIEELPVHQKRDTIELLRRSYNDIKSHDNLFPDNSWFWNYKEGV
jgi:Mn-dependent DtxR family transcriptional regulator